MSDDSVASTSGDLSVYPDIKRDDITVLEQLGVGAFGSVYRGTWRQSKETSRIIALKKVFVLEKEAEILSKIRHRNIIQFHGICKSDNDFYIVTEYAEGGSLYDHLHLAELPTDTHFKSVQKWATEVANGIHYLHYQAVDTIIHRDLKSRNVVLNRNLVCKICDFGTSKDLTHSCTAPTWGGTAAWMSPEIINQNEGLTTATDVWSYGVVLWEMLSREVPYKEFTEFRIFTLITQQGVTLAIPPSCPQHLQRLMRGCWQMQPKDRLTMKMILKELQALEDDPAMHKQCSKFIAEEDWREEIQKQKEQIEADKKALEKRKEVLKQREQALLKRIKTEETLSTMKPPPEDVFTWNENHTCQWISMLLLKYADEKFADNIKRLIFRHRITGARLLEMTKKDLEHLGLHKIGARNEVYRNIQVLKAQYNKCINFPSLEQSHALHLAVKAEKETPPLPISNDQSLVIVVGMYTRSSGSHIRYKFFVDVDTPELEVGAHTSTSPSNLVKSVCFSVLNADNNKALNEPACFSAPVCFAMNEWLISDENLQRAKVIVNVHYADNVVEPRSTELAMIVSQFDKNQTLAEREIRVKMRRKSSASPLSAAVASPTTPLRGFWVRKAAEDRDRKRSVLTEREISLISGPLTVPIEYDEFQLGEMRPRSNTFDATTEKKFLRVHGGQKKWNWKAKKNQQRLD